MYCGGCDYWSHECVIAGAHTNAGYDATHTVACQAPIHTHAATVQTTKQQPAIAISNAADNTSRSCNNTYAIATQTIVATHTSTTYYDYAHARDCMRMITPSRMYVPPRQRQDCGQATDNIEIRARSRVLSRAHIAMRARVLILGHVSNWWNGHAHTQHTCRRRSNFRRPPRLARTMVLRTNMRINTNSVDMSNIADDANDIDSYDKTSRDDLTDTKTNGTQYAYD